MATTIAKPRLQKVTKAYKDHTDHLLIVTSHAINCTIPQNIF